MKNLVPKPSQSSPGSGNQGSRTILPAKPPRSRDGCQRCKARRIKCDQRRPSCHGCLAKSLPCPGYAKDLKWSKNYEASQFTTCPRPSKRRKVGATMSPELTSCTRRASSLSLWQHTGTNSDASGNSTLGEAFHAGADVSDFPTVDPSLEMSAQPGELIDGSSTEAYYTVTPQLSSPYLAESDRSASTLRESVRLPEIGAFPSELDPGPQPNSTQESKDDELVDGYIQRSETKVMSSMHGRLVSSKHSPDPTNLLRWYYRIQPSQYSDTDLVEHYFTHVCRLYAIFDSTKNPFRALVGSNWDSSGSISLAIQSMACAHLANKDTTMVHLGRQKQREAKSSILNDLLLWRNGTITADRVLLAILLVGPTVSWHNTGDLGLDYLNIARELVTSKLCQTRSRVDGNAEMLDRFFTHAMIYWEMMVAFVNAADEMTPGDPADLELQLLHTNGDVAADTAGHSTLIKPHPWTGVAPHVTMLFAEVGRIMRRRVSGGIFATEAEARWASAIESALTNAKLPALDAVVDYEDQNTPQDHFILLAEAYRCAGLLHLYHTFPAILLRRMAESEMVMLNQATDFDAASWYRTTLALYVLSIIENLPLWSGTSCLHPILILTAGSELKLPDPLLTQEFIGDLTGARIPAARSFAEQRLSDLAKRLPQNPFLRMLDIMKETWLQLDMFGVDVHWMQVMYQKGWETIMG